MKTKLQEVFQQVHATIPANWKATMLLQGIGFLKIPLLFFVRPRVSEITDTRARVEIPLTRKTKNHLGSMYFGALAIGADCVVGLLAMHHIQKQKVHLSFKDFNADFLKRPEGNVTFLCEEGDKIAAFVQKVLQTGERHNLPVHASALVGEETVAKFILTLSLKRKS